MISPSTFYDLKSLAEHMIGEAEVARMYERAHLRAKTPSYNVDGTLKSSSYALRAKRLFDAAKSLTQESDFAEEKHDWFEG